MKRPVFLYVFVPAKIRGAVNSNYLSLINKLQTPCVTPTIMDDL